MKYTFVTNAVVSFTTEVEAATLEEAIDEASGRSVMSLCHQCCGGGDAEEWSTELDTDSPGKLVDLWCGEDNKGETSAEFMLAKESFE